MHTKGKLASVLLATLLLAACGGGGLNGTYSVADGTGIASYTFGPGGKVEVNALGSTTEMHYEVDGNKVKIGLSGNTNGPMQVMTIQPDGSISGPMGIRLTKTK